MVDDERILHYLQVRYDVRNASLRRLVFRLTDCYIGQHLEHDHRPDHGGVRRTFQRDVSK